MNSEIREIDFYKYEKSLVRDVPSMRYHYYAYKLW